MKKIGVDIVVCLACLMTLPSLANRKKIAVAVQKTVIDTLPKNDRKRFDYFFLEAARQQAVGNYADALALYNHARKINPNAAETYYYLSLYYSQMKQDPLALSYLQKAIILCPENSTYQERLGEYYLGKQLYADAIGVYETISVHNHENTDALRILLQLYQQQKQYPQMLNTISRLENEEGESEQFTLTKMHVYEMMNDPKRAHAELKSLVEAHPLDAIYKTMLGNWLMQHDRQKEAYKYFVEVLKDEPDNAYAQTSLYDYYNAVGMTAEAGNMLDRILLGKYTDDETKGMMLRSFIQNNEHGGADSTKVLELFDKMLNVPTPSATVAELRAAYMNMKKMPQDSVNAAFQKVIDIAPDNSAARLQLIQNLWNKKDYDAVISMAKAAHEYNPDEMVFYYFGGMAYYQKNNENATLEEFRHGLAQVNDKSSPDLVSDLYMVVGDILAKQKKNNEAFAAYDSCLQWKSDNVAALNNYAYYLSLENRDLHKAELMSYKAIKAEPKNATYLDTYAWILFVEERYADAKNYIDETLNNVDSLESNTAIFEHAGDIYSMNGLTEEALEYWKKAYENGEKTKTLEWKIENRRYITEEQLKKIDSRLVQQGKQKDNNSNKRRKR